MSYPIPNDFWCELTSSQPSFLYRDLLKDPDFLQRLEVLLARYGYRVVKVGECTDRTSIFYDNFCWLPQGSGCCPTLDYKLVVQRRKSYQP